MIDLKDLLKAGVHFGHKSSRWSPKMRPFIWGAKNKIHLIDLAKTAFLMERAGKYLKGLASNGKSVLWIGTKKPAQGPVKKVADSLKMPFVINRWIGGTLTNFMQVKKAITRLLYLRDIIKKSTSHYTKKEHSMIQKEIFRLERNIGGIIDLNFPPAAIVIVDAKKELSSIREALNSNIPIIGIVDTNTDPTGINFVIPANDDSPRSIAFIMDYLASCVEEGQKIYKEKKIKDEAEKKASKKATSTLTKKVDAKLETKKEEKVAASKEAKTKQKTAQVKPAPVKKEVAKAKEAPVKKTASETSKKADGKIEEKKAEKSASKKVTATTKVAAKTTKTKAAAKTTTKKATTTKNKTKTKKS